jgi:hypothetical protein
MEHVGLWGWKFRQLFVTAVRLLLFQFVTIFTSFLYHRLVTSHAEYTLRRPCIPQVLNLLLAIPAAEATGAESLITRQDGEVLDFVATCVAGVCAVVADQRSVAEEE